jgi:hypothetical protein
MTTFRTWAVAVAAVVTVVVAVSAVVTSPGTRPVSVARPPGPQPAPGRTIVLDNRSGGSSVTTSTRSRVVVELTGRGAMRWSSIAASPAAGALVRQSGSQSSDGSSKAVFAATRAGRATLTSTGAPICSPGVACPQYLELWRVSVVVAK